MCVLREPILDLADKFESAGDWASERIFSEWMNRQEWRSCLPSVFTYKVPRVSWSKPFLQVNARIIPVKFGNDKIVHDMSTQCDPNVLCVARCDLRLFYRLTRKWLRLLLACFFLTKLLRVSTTSGLAISFMACWLAHLETQGWLLALFLFYSQVFGTRICDPIWDINWCA